MIAAVVSGGFDPIHSGHIRMIREASRYGEALVVLVNTDEWLLRKKGYVSMSLQERMEIVSSIEGVTRVHPAEDDDGTVSKSLITLSKEYKNIIFCNGGDRIKGNTPEMSVINSIGGQYVFGVGGDKKINSSSTIWPKHSLGKVQRLWGSYYDHFRTDGCVFKTMEFEPNKGTSHQRHFQREEVWHIEAGSGVAVLNNDVFLLKTGSNIYVPRETWHSFAAGPEGATVREMQTGFCREDDIERK